MNKKQENVFIKCILLFLLISLCMTGCGSISDGEYTASVSRMGGSGRASIDSPCKVIVDNGKAYADIVWSSPNYDYMIVGGETYYPVNSEGNSEFLIPIELDKDMEIQADTTAMSTPHLIDYTLRISITDDNATNVTETDVSVNTSVSVHPDIPGIDYLSTDENNYAECFAIHRYSDGINVVSVDDGRTYLIIPEGVECPADISDEIIILKQPLDRIYLAASGTMCQFDAIGAVDNIVLSGIERDDWYIETARVAMDSGTLIYGGKYSAPDYETMVMNDINLAIENTMILHVPKVQEKIEKIGIPVFIDRSSYETQPLGRCEWVKVYGILTGREKEANEALEAQDSLTDSLKNSDISGKTVAIFSVNSNNQIVTRKKNDYFSKMVEMAGGTYLAPNAEDDEKATAQVTISMEAFYDYGDTADILIYNATIEDAPKSLEELSQVSETFMDFKAYREGQVWYTDKSLYQYADKTGTVIENLYQIISGNKEETEFFHKLK
jgi:iron complex transport system substrate-binding protein